MDRPTRPKARLTLAIVAALILAPAPAASAAPASDEYVFQLPGVHQADDTVAPSGRGGTMSGHSVQRGVVGETDLPAGPLAALGDALGAIPASIAVGLAALLALALATMFRRRPTAHDLR